MATDSAPIGAGRLESRLRAGAFAFTAEITPPVAGDAETLWARAAPMQGVVDALNVTDGASARVHISSLAAAAVLAARGLEPVMQATCRDRNRIALQSDLLGAGALGIQNVLFLTGDDPKAGDHPDAKPVFDLDSRTLIEAAAGIRAGRLLSGREIERPPHLFIGAADVPTEPTAKWSAASLNGKVAAGAQFVQTQICLDAGLLRRYFARLVEEGLTERLHFLVGVCPPASARSAEWMRTNLFGVAIPDEIVARLAEASDARAEGVAICAELLQQLADIPGVAGAHVMAPVNTDCIPETIARSGLR